MTLLQKKMSISDDIRSITLSLRRVEANDVDVSALYCAIYSKERFFVADHVDIKIGTTTARLTGRTDSKAGNSAGSLTTSLLAPVSEDLVALAKESGENTPVIARISTKKGDIDINVPFHFIRLYRTVYRDS